MKIVVTIKQVPARDSQLRISGKWIEDADLSYEINEPDAYALEEALRLKEKHGGEVIALPGDQVAKRPHRADGKPDIAVANYSSDNVSESRDSKNFRTFSWKSFLPSLSSMKEMYNFSSLDNCLFTYLVM